MVNIIKIITNRFFVFLLLGSSLIMTNSCIEEKHSEDQSAAMSEMTSDQEMLMIRENKCTEQHLYPDFIWMETYSKYIHDSIDAQAYKSYTLCYVDNDTIPELYIMGTSYADGTLILSQHKEKCSCLKCHWSPYYIERSGLINDGWAHSGSFGNCIYALTNDGFQKLITTEAIWYDNDVATTTDDYFVFWIDGVTIDTIQGNNEDDAYNKCKKVKRELDKLYYSHGESKWVLDNTIEKYYIANIY
ncbi:MAG: hypothetical protein IJK62_14495 [Bacteroidales bacterium]|nr:hypothetical protein [Bacteroidales bacterium]